MPYHAPPSIDNRGSIDYSDEGVGLADQVAISRKLGDESYAWVPITDHISRDLSPNDGPYGYTNLGAGPTAGAANYKPGVDLAPYTQARLTFYQVCTNGNTGTTHLRYSLDNGSTWADLIAAVDGVPATAGTGWKQTAWVTIPAPARTMCTIGHFGSGGDGVEDIEVRSPIADFR